MDHSAEVLIFEVEGQRHALPVAQVRELLPAMTLTLVPGAPAGVEGVINLRGVIMPVVDVRQRLGLPGRALGPSDHFIVTAFQKKLAVLRVDRALELARLSTHSDSAAESTEPSRCRVVQCGDALVVLHEASHFLTAADLDMRASGPPDREDA